MKRQIIIAQRGWIFVGDVSQDGVTVTIQNAKNIRRWGTSRGLGQLAMSGPTGSTVMDDMGIVSLHELSIVARIDVTARSL